MTFVPCRAGAKGRRKPLIHGSWLSIRSSTNIVRDPCKPSGDRRHQVTVWAEHFERPLDGVAIDRVEYDIDVADRLVKSTAA